MTIEEKISKGQCFLGIELGSTRIKAVMTDDKFNTAAMGSHKWENRYENGYWTYSPDDIHRGLKDCYADLKKNVKEQYGITLTSFKSMGISGMMHGYMPFDSGDNLLVPFRTWRNTTTAVAAEELTKLFGFNIPQRWSIAHLYQAVIDGEPHVKDISYITTLAVYVHYLLTGVRAVGFGEASGMFPVDKTGYCGDMLYKFSRLTEKYNLPWKIEDVLPVIADCNKVCGRLTEKGAKFLDPDGDLREGVPFCAPEGDAGTGMVATNAVRERTANVSAGTSVFSMAVLEKPLSRVYPQIDVVSTPSKSPVAMVHCNNCCGELDAWVGVFAEFCSLMGMEADISELYRRLYQNGLKNGDRDCGGVVAYNFISAEPVADIEKGRPLYFRGNEGGFNLANFFRAELTASLAALKMGMDILFKEEKVKLDKLAAHGGLFKVENAAEQLLADGLSTPVTLMETAGEGGAWGMAILAAYALEGDKTELADFLDRRVFKDMKSRQVFPDSEGVLGFEEYMERYKKGLKAVDRL